VLRGNRPTLRVFAEMKEGDHLISAVSPNGKEIKALNRPSHSLAIKRFVRSL
jgi:hypothetical protein